MARTVYGLSPYLRGSMPGLRTFDDMFDLMRMPFASSEALSSMAGGFKLDVEETDGGYTVTAELPGVNKEDVELEFNEQTLSITAEHKSVEDEQGKNYLVKERASWKATRGVFLRDADASKISAKLDQGILTITVPKRQEMQNVTKIAID